MIPYKYAYLFEQDSVHKEIQIEYDGGIITNKELYSEQFELHESLYSDNSIRFGACESNYVKFRVRRTVEKMFGKKITVRMIIDGNTDEPLQLGIYTVKSDTPSADRFYRDIVAYDAMYALIHTDIKGWVNENITFPITANELMYAVLDYFGLEYGSIVLQTGGVAIYGINPDMETVTGQNILECILEPSCLFGNIDQYGKFQAIYLDIISKKGLYPSGYIYPTYAQFPREEQNYYVDGFNGIYDYTGGKLNFDIWDKFYLDTSYFISYNSKQKMWMDLPDFNPRQRFCCYLNKDEYKKVGQSYYYKVQFYYIKDGVIVEWGFPVKAYIDKGSGEELIVSTLYCYADNYTSSFNKITGIPCFYDMYSMERWLQYGEVYNCINWNGTYEYKRKLCMECAYEDFTLEKIGRSSIESYCDSFEKIPFGASGQKYDLDNIFIYGKDETEIMEDCIGILSSFVKSAKSIYGSRPVSASMLGNPCISLGDSVRINARLGTFDTYVTERTISGIQRLKDSISFNVEYGFSEDI